MRLEECLKAINTARRTVLATPPLDAKLKDQTPAYLAAWRALAGSDTRCTAAVYLENPYV